MVTAMVHSLEKGGYLCKIPSQTDGRSYDLHPSNKARDLVEQTYEAYLHTIGLLHDKLGESDYEALIALLNRANAILLEG